MKHIIDDSDKNKYEAYTKEEVLQVIQEAISSGELPEEINGLVLTFKNPVDNQGYKIAFCTQAKYNELKQAGTLETNCVYFITDDTSYDDIVDALNGISTDITSLQDDVSDNTERIENLEENQENKVSKKVTQVYSGETDESEIDITEERIFLKNSVEEDGTKYEARVKVNYDEIVLSFYEDQNLMAELYFDRNQFKHEDAYGNVIDFLAMSQYAVQRYSHIISILVSGNFFSFEANVKYATQVTDYASFINFLKNVGTHQTYSAHETWTFVALASGNINSTRITKVEFTLDYSGTYDLTVAYRSTTGATASTTLDSTNTYEDDVRTL